MPAHPSGSESPGYSSPSEASLCVFWLLHLLWPVPPILPCCSPSLLIPPPSHTFSLLSLLLSFPSQICAVW